MRKLYANEANHCVIIIIKVEARNLKSKQHTLIWCSPSHRHRVKHRTAQYQCHGFLNNNNNNNKNTDLKLGVKQALCLCATNARSQHVPEEKERKKTVYD